MKEIWICKPTDLSRGRNIFLIDDIAQLGKNAFNQSCIIQRYITNPLLIMGYKWDLRLYVLVTSVQPLTIFMYEEGLVRFSTKKFSLRGKDISDRYVHLTNSSVNKHNQKKDLSIGPNSKWTLAQLKEYFSNSKIEYDSLF